MFTFLFADLAGFTALTEAHGDNDATTIVTRFYDLARASLVDNSRLVKTIGDAVMIVAEDAPAAVLTTLRLVNSVHAEPEFPALRAGLHSGPAVEQDGDYFGATVNLAARVTSYARSGQVLCTESVVESIRSLENVVAHPTEIADFKNVSHPVTLFEIEDAQSHKLHQEIDPVCRMGINPDTAPARLPFQDVVYWFCSFECAKKFAQSPEDYVKPR